MLTEQVEDWTKEWWENGLKQGREEGLEEGQKKGELLILVRQLERKFGLLSEQNRLRLEEADIDTLLECSDRILTANSIDEVLQH